MDVRYELLPFASAEPEAAAVSRPLTLTVTCSPRHGMDHSLEVAGRLSSIGHSVVLHMAARMVSGPEHLDSLLKGMADAGIADVFLVGGDATDPLGPYTSGLDLIGELRGHAQAPRSIGVPAYPEGHPLIDDITLADALAEKARLADYMTTQICFDPDALLTWLESTRAAGVDLPLFVGVPGQVNRRKLIEISMRIGVGGSIRFIRKQRGVMRLFGRSADPVERLISAASSSSLGIAGFHFFTFNRLVETVAFVDQRQARHTVDIASPHPTPTGVATPP
jgi:methylenetetrahydrofolate reductase (NADPH)